MTPTSPNIVYLHIPKAGGSSQRTLFYDLFGKERVAWHGIDIDARTT
ncbi:MAG: hypothetical protein R3228_02595 [Halioglobus sp.]|nr:hypothetical protein [Halioglobus sp.]